MKTIYLDRDNTADLEPAVATIGFFDGVHRGHRFLIGQVTDEARRRGLRSMVITFDQHPRQVLQQNYQPQLLSTLENKLVLLSRTGVDYVVVVHFDLALASLSAQQFMELILRQQLHVRQLVIGYDNRFGHDRTEGFSDYVRYGRGYPYTIEGKVVDGVKEGRRLGFPTANLVPSSLTQLLPAAGVYGVKVRTEGSMTQRPGMTNIGMRPTFGGHHQTVETNIFDFEDDIYGQRLLLSFYCRIRDERRFDNVEQLIQQLRHNNPSRTYFNQSSTMKRSSLHDIANIVLYVILFLLIQLAVTFAVAIIAMWIGGTPWPTISQHLQTGSLGLNGKELVAATAISSVLTFCLFLVCHWASVKRDWLATRPWTALIWVVILALGTILPSEWLVERMEITLPESTEKLFESIMGEPLGYVAIGILAPLVEELVFRGAILRTLLKLFDRKWHWVAIVISALIFGAVHMNIPQFVHAALIGLLLGWMYYRTDSIIPGVAFHWINNTVAFVMFHMMPQMNDGKLIDLFHGNHTSMMLSLLFSLCIFLPALFQLSIRLKRAK